MRPLTCLRAGYVLAALATTTVIWLFASGKIYALFVAPLMHDSPALATVAIVPMIIGGLFLLGLQATFLLLAWRPKWWGKLVLALPAVGWIFYTMAISIIAPRLGPEADPWVVWAPGLAGVALLLVAVVHQFLQPRLGLADRGSLLELES